MSSVPIKMHQPCPDCGSSDALTEYSDGHTHCFSCEQTKYPEGETEVSPSFIPVDTLEPMDLSARGLTKETCGTYQYFCGKYKSKPVQVACYYDDGGILIGQKVRFPDKTFVTLGKISTTFYGQQKFSGGKGKLVITEGEIDCLTVSQLQGNKYPVVSLPCGCTSAKKVVEHNLEWLSTFDQVILMFDMDKPGREACATVAPLLKNTFIASLPLKDPNECLQAGLGKEVIQAIWNAKPYKPDGIINGADLWERLKDQTVIPSVPYPWDDTDINKLTGGIRKGELVMVTAGTGVGKTTFFKQIMYHLGMTEKAKVGTLMLEENITKTALSLMSIHCQKPLHLNSSLVSPEKFHEINDSVLGTGRFVFYDHFGSLDGNSLLSKIRYLAVSEKCDYIFLDHLTIAVSGLQVQKGTEAQMIDYLMTQLRSIVEETGCGLFVICHLSRRDKKETAHEEGGKIALTDLRGSQGTSQLTDVVIGLERNTQGENADVKNTTRIRILKNRFSGETGIAGYLLYDKSTGIMKAVGKPTESEAEF